MWSIDKSVEKDFSFLQIKNVSIEAEKNYSGNFEYSVIVTLTNKDNKMHSFGYRGMLLKNGNYLGEFSVHGWPFDGIKLMPGQTVTKKSDYCSIQDPGMLRNSGLLVKIGFASDVNLEKIDVVFTEINIDK